MSHLPQCRKRTEPLKRPTVCRSAGPPRAGLKALPERVPLQLPAGSHLALPRTPNLWSTPPRFKQASSELEALCLAKRNSDVKSRSRMGETVGVAVVTPNTLRPLVERPEPTTSPRTRLWRSQGAVPARNRRVEFIESGTGERPEGAPRPAFRRDASSGPVSNRRTHFSDALTAS